MLGKAFAVGLIGLFLFAGNAPSRESITGVAYFRQRVTASSSQGSFPGATQTWRSRILLLHEDRAIGIGGIACILTSNTRRECFGTFVLPQGRIKVLGEVLNRNYYTLVIVGGTGIYSNAKGVATFTPTLATFYLN